MDKNARVLYMSGSVPTRSETFVYREILALRELGIDVRTASVHAPTHGLDSAELEQMANETIELYSAGKVEIMRETIAELITHPLRTIRTMTRVKLDALFSPEVSLKRKPKVIWQGLAGLALARCARKIGITHIHAHMAHVPTTIAMYAAKQLGTGFSFTGHAIDLFPNRTLLKEKLERAVFVNCISHWHRRFYQDIVKRSDADLPIVRCGVDTARYQTTPAPGGRTLEVLGVGRLVEKKGFDVLVGAAGRLAGAGVPVRVRIAGGGPELNRLKSMVEALPSGASVEMLGETDNDRVMELMSEADVFALPCRVAKSGDRDGIPVVLMEAMARGRCVISGDLETIRELIEDGTSGVMIPPGDLEALVDVLRSLAADREKVDELGRAARKRIEDEFDLMSNARRIVDTMRRHGVLDEGAGE
ncbi:MAG: glycosyltransferase family 4 protein [Phycisphaerales bacterium]|nr:glycosyltransferase family 4 protein [Phycisphaerales bacterium]